MKQKGAIMKGTTELFDLKGKVSGNQLKGRVITAGPISDFVINISQDYQSFEGKLGRTNRRIKGKRKE
jgi:hypothetical protein